MKSRIDKDIQKGLLDIALALTKETDYNRLLDKIVTEARKVTHCDGGTLYLLSDQQLHHKIMQTNSLGFYKGGDGEPVDIAPLALTKDHVASYCAITTETINIKDVYHSELFDFSGPKEFDQVTGYKTKSMLVCPLISRQKKVVGVLQLINAEDVEGKLTSFDQRYEAIIESLASQAGILLENMQYISEIRQLFESFVQVIATTIDERTPYNTKHSENMSVLIGDFAAYLNQLNQGPYKDIFFSEADIYELETAAWLHDIGKIVVPLEILDKATRLADRYEGLLCRHKLIATKLERNYYKGLLENSPTEKFRLKARYEEDIKYLSDIRALVDEVNQPSYIVDGKTKRQLTEIHESRIDTIDDLLITAEELEHLSIPKGTLTAGERQEIENHVSAGARILAKMQFPDYLSRIYDWIIKHHEFLDGSGYTQGHKGHEIPLEARMLTIADIYESLVVGNRPYKKAYSKEKSVRILISMAEAGKLDSDLVDAFLESGLWESCDLY